MKNRINIECTVTALSDTVASEIFKVASRRLLNVNTWSNLDGSLVPPFQLIDKNGKIVDREVLPSDYLKIEDSSGDNSDSKWMKVERVEERHGDQGMETVVFEARPTDNPYGEDSNPGSFSRPGIFRIVKKGLRITASVYAEGEDSEMLDNVVDRMRGVSKLAYATLGAYCVQWRSLVNAILTQHEVDSHDLAV